jgi:hypothetical protein
MPKKMMFRGRRIKVSHAPEPDEIMWENLEVGAHINCPFNYPNALHFGHTTQVSTFTKMWRRTLTALCALVLILIGIVDVCNCSKYIVIMLSGFAIVLQAANYKEKFDNDIPKLYMCETEVNPVRF